MSCARLQVAPNSVVCEARKDNPRLTAKLNLPDDLSERHKDALII